MGIIEPGHVACNFDHCNLHTEADAEVWNPILARIPHRGDLALDTPLAEPARHDDAIHIPQAFDAVFLDVLRLEVVNIDPRAGMYAAMQQRF